ncbi:MAG: trehalose-6-phosphate synthase [Pseudomonadota bacterium]
MTTSASRSSRGLVVVSNRLPGPAAIGGGLITALDPVLREYRGRWVGWDGGCAQGWKPPPAGLGYRLDPVSLRDKEVEHYYHGFSNRTLWPLLHSLVGRTEIRHNFWRAYEAVNERFAAAVLAGCAPADLIWVHDYHLMLLPRLLREKGHAGPISWFLHTPFPPYEVFRILPWRRQLLEGLLGADVLAFQTRGYCQSFLECAGNVLNCPVEEDAIQFDGRWIKIHPAPISIDTAYFEQLGQRTVGGARLKRLTRHLEGCQVVLGVDRLDYTKGIHERLAAVERLLEEHPEHCQRVVFIQVAVPSRTRLAGYRNMKRQIDEKVGQINGRFTDGSWLPVRYLYRCMPPETLGAYYALADVALVTPLRDGMNLVAKEYVACHSEEGGALVLSELAGAAEELRGAISVNPYDIDGVAAALHRALAMDPAEKRRRMAAMKSYLRRHDVSAWAAGLVSEMEAHVPEAALWSPPGTRSESKSPRGRGALLVP